MFILSEFTKTIRIPPSQFGMSLIDAVTEELNKKLANKVVHKTGLCITLFDILKMDESFIFPGDGASHTKVSFRFAVFRPFIDEILVGRIKKCSREGVHVSLGFFDDIIIPSDALQHPSKFDESEQVWIWEYDGNPLFMDRNKEIRFRVVDETFVDTSPTGPDSSELTLDDTKVPYLLTGSINEPGLGLLEWWTQSSEAS